MVIQGFRLLDCTPRAIGLLYKVENQNALHRIVAVEPNNNDFPSCEVCTEVSAKYKCPRCGVRTCCVACVKKHKWEESCSGLRDKTAFVPLSAFSDNNLLSDYHFLEDVARKTDNAARQSRQHERRDRSRFLHKLVSQARKRRIDLQILPYSFGKRKCNTTVYWKREEKFMWHIEWAFPGAGAKYTDNRVCEDSTLEEALKRYLHPTESDPVIRHRLRDYVREGAENCSVCMKVEGMSASAPRYHKLDLKETIANNLKGKRIVEFPTLEVVLPDQLSKYTLVHREDDNHRRLKESTPREEMGEYTQDQQLGESVPKENTEESVHKQKEEESLPRENTKESVPKERIGESVSVDSLKS